MPIYLEDGSLTSSNLGFSAVRRGDRKDCFISKARVDEVLYVDDVRNSTYGTNNPQVQYVCTVLSGSDSGKRIFNVIAATSLGGEFNYSEIIHQPMAGDDFSGREEKSPAKTHGEIVLIVKLNGAPQAAVIIGALRHPLSKTSTTKADGQRSVTEFNGVKTEVSEQGSQIVGQIGGVMDTLGNLSLPDPIAIIQEEIKKTLGFASSFTLSPTGAVSIAKRGLQRMGIDNLGQPAIKGIGAGLKLGVGGVNKLSGTVTDIKSKVALNISSTLTKIGQKALPTARIGDASIGTDSNGAPVVSRAISGSYISMIGS